MTDLLSPPYYRRISDTYYIPTLPTPHAASGIITSTSTCTPHSSATNTNSTAHDVDIDTIAFKYVFPVLDVDGQVETDEPTDKIETSVDDQNNKSDIKAKEENLLTISTATQGEVEDRNSPISPSEGSESGGSHSQTEVASIIEYGDTVTPDVSCSDANEGDSHSTSQQ